MLNFNFPEVVLYTGSELLTLTLQYLVRYHVIFSTFNHFFWFIFKHKEAVVEVKWLLPKKELKVYSH